MHDEHSIRTYQPRRNAAWYSVAASERSAARPAAEVAASGDALAAYRVTEEPYYRAVGDEVALYEAAYSVRMPIMLKGPTGCGKTRFVEYMAWKLNRPLVTVACHEDLSATDLVGRYLLEGEQTIWHDGPLSTAVKHGA